MTTSMVQKQTKEVQFCSLGGITRKRRRCIIERNWSLLVRNKVLSLPIRATFSSVISRRDFELPQCTGCVVKMLYWCHLMDLLLQKATSSCDFKTSVSSSRISPSTFYAMARGKSEASSTILEWKYILQLVIVPLLSGAKISA